MSLMEGLMSWIVSFLILVFMLFIAYRISYKHGIKKALYRTTYILLSLIFAFVLAPIVSDLIFQFDLSKWGITLKFQEREFFTLIDYIEEVIVHSKFLNDLYAYFPSLKNLFMDFPQIILVPILYVVLFFVFLIVWMPLYLYLSFKRKRRILYEREDNKAHRVWAGILGCFQLVFVVSTVLSPLNGISRIYQNSTKDTLGDKYDTLCDEHEVFEDYKQYCDLLETYNATVFANLGGNNSVSSYIFDSLTRISYEDGYTSLSKETTLIVKSGIVLNQSGLLDSLLTNSETLPLNFMVGSNLTDEDIDVIVETLSESKYSESLLLELENLVSNTLNRMLKDYFGYDELLPTYMWNKEGIINEIKVGLKTLNLLGNSTLVDDLANVIEQIVYYATVFPENRKTDITTIKFIVDMLNSVDLNDVEMAINYLLESKIFNNAVPYLLDVGLGPFGFDFFPVRSDLEIQIGNALYFGKIVKKYQPENFFELFRRVNDEELINLADIVSYLIQSPDSVNLVKFILSEAMGRVGISYLPSDFLNIKDWRREAFVLRDICILADDSLKGTEITLERVVQLLDKYKDTEAIKIAKKLALQNSSFFLKELILAAGK